MRPLPEELQQYVTHGQEEVYLEYKGDVSWQDKGKKLEIIQTIFALANGKGGGVIVVGVNDKGEVVGLSDANYSSYSHDHLHQSLSSKGNQPVECKLQGFEYSGADSVKKIIVIQVSETKEFPLVYVGQTEKINEQVDGFSKNIGLRNGALYIRNKQNVGNKEIETIQEWQEIIERTYKKYEGETIRRHSILGIPSDPYDNELTI